MELPRVKLLQGENKMACTRGCSWDWWQIAPMQGIWVCILWAAVATSKGITYVPLR